MTYRELWHEIMFYGEFDRMPAVHWAQWDETLERWHAEGLPEGMNPRAYLDVPAHWAGVGINVNLFPAFEEEVLEETDEYRIFRDGAGVICKDWKHKSSIPHYLDYTLKEAKDWPAFKERLQPDMNRYDEAGLLDGIAKAEASDLPIVVSTASMMGWIRNWMGVENMCYLMFDAPDTYADMVDTLSDLSCWALEIILPKMNVTPLMGFGWEDICGKSGPLVSPDLFDKYVARGYRKMRDKLESYGVKLLGIDTDGYVEPMIRNWLDAGVNVQFPIEIGTWNADPHALRRKCGKELRIVGGINKLVLEQGRRAIDAEIERRKPLMAEGGFVPMPDHLITPGAPLDDYKYFLDRMKELRF